MSHNRSINLFILSNSPVADADGPGQENQPTFHRRKTSQGKKGKKKAARCSRAFHWTPSLPGVDAEWCNDAALNGSLQDNAVATDADGQGLVV